MKTRQTHRHKAARSETRPFFGCVRPRACNEASHGNNTVHETCSCGAERRRNVNQLHDEYGPWTEGGAG